MAAVRLQVLTGTAQGLERALAFPCFELPEANDGTFEPRRIEAGDVDGDGREDIVLIAFDRVLIYLQER